MTRNLGEHAIAIGQDDKDLTPSEIRSFEIQRSTAFWEEPKELLLTLAVGCLAAMVQGEYIR